MSPSRKHEVIDVDDVDVFCTGVGHCAHIDRPSSLRHRHRPCDPVTISLLDSDSDSEDPPVRQHNSHPRSHSATGQYTELQRVTQLELASRKTLNDAHPSKNRATDALKMATDRVNNRLKRKERVLDVIEISSDSEPEVWPSKKQKTDEDTESPYDKDGTYGAPEVILKLDPEFSCTELRSPSPADQHYSDADDDDCIDILALLDISNEAHWVPLPERNKAEDLTPMHESDSDLHKPKPPPPLRLPRKRPPVDHRRLPFDWISVGPWGTLSKNHGATRFPKPFYHSRRQENLFFRRPPNLYYGNKYSKLELTAKYPHLMSGSVNKIIQARDSVVVCAVAEGGLDESDNDEDAEDLPPPPPENRLGSLVVYRRGRVYMPLAHCRPRETSRGSTTKYYTVDDIVFNPFNPRQFLSSGCDRAVQVWKILDHDDNNERQGLNAIHRLTFDSRPQDLLYAPDGQTLAITFHDGTVRLCSQDLFEDMIEADLLSKSKRLRVAPRGSGHATGSTLWGKGPSKHLLFSSSEPGDEDDYSGFHYAFDTRQGVPVVQFDATESGDAAALTPDGATLVLFTWSKDGTHPVRLYDVRRKDKEAYGTEKLERFQASGSDSEEVNKASFSPDGRLLAVARNDNALHIYDMRALSRGPLCRFEHHDSDNLQGRRFGVIGANWIQSRDRIGIMSGGNDGCVRLWEPGLGSTDEAQGAVIGRTDFDVGHFSIGDSQNGEFPLVIGDSGGGMHTYDFPGAEGLYCKFNE